MSECPVCLGVPGYDIHMCGKGGFDMPEPSVDGAAWNRSTGAQQQLLNREIDSLREMAKEANDLAALQSELDAAKEELARAREALIKQWELVFTRSYSQNPIGRAEARYAREIAHKGEEG